jgi:hypothetical protein
MASRTMAWPRAEVHLVDHRAGDGRELTLKV